MGSGAAGLYRRRVPERFLSVGFPPLGKAECWSFSDGATIPLAPPAARCREFELLVAHAAAASSHRAWSGATARSAAAQGAWPGTRHRARSQRVAPVASPGLRRRNQPSLTYVFSLQTLVAGFPSALDVL